MRALPVLPAGLVLLLLLTSCSSGGGTKAAAGARTVKVTISDRGCAVDTNSVPAGGVVFTISNASSSKVTEAELMSGERILAEKENIAAGLSASFALKLEAGSYAVRCPGGSGPKDVAFTVTGASVADAPEQRAAATGWGSYVRAQVQQQVTATKVLTDAVRRGDLSAAAAAYPAARVNYERIEPVAESFGNIDPALDLRVAGVTDPAKWTGYHRLEKALFADRSLAGMVPIADALDADVAKLVRLVRTATFTAPDLANGAGELLNEIGVSKITGEEEAYSHIDLVDIQANVDGARRAFELLSPAVQPRDAALVQTITRRFAAVDAQLDRYRTGTGPTDFRPYPAVPPDQRRKLSDLVDALAEPLSRVGGLLVRT